MTDPFEAEHTQFLDLTNGEGGEWHPLQAQEDEDEDDGGGMMETTLPSRAAVDPSAPGGVVEAGREHTGRWTKEEHEAFLSALQMYGKEWKKVAAKVKTRTVVQTRTHAQKYFQKLQKTMETTGVNDITHVEMGVSSTAEKKVKKKRATPSIASKPNRRSSSTTLSAAQVISNLSSSTPPGSFVATGSSSTMHAPTRPHGFSTESSFSTPSYPWGTSSSMKIVAPDPTASLRRNKFPEPSPAATGKRKLAEIAAARMLAGVGSQATTPDEGPPTPPPAGLNLKEAPPPPLFGGEASLASRTKGLSLQIVNPASLGVTHEKRRKGADGETSPVTPWDGQLEALVSEKAASKTDADEKRPAEPRSNGDYLKLSPQPVCGSGTLYGRTSLHKAVCDMDLEALRLELGVITDETKHILQRFDEAGYSPLHTACALRLTQSEKAIVSGEMVRMLVTAGADIGQEDSKGNTPLHWAARAGDKEVVEILLFKNCPLDSKNKDGEAPLHWAMRAGRRGMEVVSFLLENCARPGVLNKSFRRPLDVASYGFPEEEGSLANIKVKETQQGKKLSREWKRALKETAGDRRDSRANLLIRSSQSRTLVLHHPECLEHHPKSSTDWEAPDRVISILRRVVPSSDSTGTTETSGIFPHEVTVSKEFERAKLDLLSRVHSTDYLSFVSNLSKDLEKQLKEAGDGPIDESEHGFTSPAVVPFTPMVQRSMIKVDESSVKLGINSDTSFSAGSLRAARRAAGAVQHAVDCVLVGRNRNAFCVVRPPGHHAGINGLLDGGESCGFCIFNNVAAGALYAIQDDRLLCERCAIVDIDVHHGNGTEEIVRKYHDPSKLFFFSIHLYDNDRKKRGANQYSYKFYPGTGLEDDLALNIINVPIVPLWKEVAPATAQIAVKTHNTRRKTSRLSQDSQDEGSEGGTNRESARASDVESQSGSANGPGSVSPPRANSSVSASVSVGPSSGRMAYRQAIQNRLLPALRAFNPDLILIGAGFDAAKGDVGNARHERGGERMGLDLEPEDYAWTTRKILEIADICCQGRVVSVLEGGYGRTPPTAHVEGQPEALDRTLFAECAIRHLHAMIDPYNTESRFSC